jgi:hypothetical protein
MTHGPAMNVAIIIHVLLLLTAKLLKKEEKSKDS